MYFDRSSKHGLPIKSQKSSAEQVVGMSKGSRKSARKQKNNQLKRPEGKLGSTDPKKPLTFPTEGPNAKSHKAAKMMEGRNEGLNE